MAVTKSPPVFESLYAGMNTSAIHTKIMTILSAIINQRGRRSDADKLSYDSSQLHLVLAYLTFKELFSISMLFRIRGKALIYFIKKLAT